MKKKYQAVVLFEGTGLSQHSQSNVGKLSRALEHNKYQGVKLLAGSGTYHFKHIRGALAGLDAKSILSDAYLYLSTFFETKTDNNPRIFLFGFSRGALYARVLGACLCDIGLATIPSQAKDIFSQWFEKELKSSNNSLRAKGKTRCVDLRYIGVWDTVDATVGIEGNEFINAPKEVREARHAVAINEYRSYFNYVPMKGDNVIERFFAGAHSDIGGGYKDHALADIPGEWIAKGGIRHGLRIKKDISWQTLPLTTNKSIIHNSLCEASNLWGAMSAIVRNIDPKRLHRSVRAIKNRVLLPNGTPVLPDEFKNAPTE